MKKSLILMHGLWVFVMVFFLPRLTSQKQLKILNIKLDTSMTYLVKLKDDNTFSGRFLSLRDSTFIFSSKTMKVEVLRSDIASIKQIDSTNIVKGKFWFANPHYSRYLFGPSAFNLKKGEGYYQNIYGTINSVNVGITDHFSFGGGTEIISLFGGYPILMLTPKFGNYKLAPKVHAGGGAFMAITSEGTLGIGYGIITQGTENKNITLGLGWAFSSEGSLQTKPVVTISGMSRLGKNTSFITENWLVPADGYELVFSYGLRFFGEKISVDVAFINSPNIASEIIAIGIPYIDFVYKF